MANYTENLGLFKYDIVADEKVPFSITNALNNNWDILDEKCGNARNIGEIVTSTIPLTDAGLHLLDGALIEGNGIYNAFVDYIAGLVSEYPNLFCTETAWQTAVTTYGVCGKFVYDSTNNTIRLPKVTGIIEGTTDVSALGSLVEAGLPLSWLDHTHTRGDMEISGNFVGGHPNGVCNGAFGNAGNSGSTQEGSAYHEAQLNFYASRSWTGSTSAPNYVTTVHNTSTVQPQTIKVLYYIVIATSTKTDIQIDIDEVATDLNGKADADLSNVPTSKGILTETYVNGTSWYRVYSDGWCEQGGLVTNYSANGTPITYLKTMKNTNYCLICSYNGNNIGDNNYDYHCINLTVNGATLIVANNGTLTSNGINVYWQVSGYIR